MTSEQFAQMIRDNHHKWGLWAMCRWAKKRHIKPEFVINSLAGRV